MRASARTRGRDSLRAMQQEADSAPGAILAAAILASSMAFLDTSVVALLGAAALAALAMLAAIGLPRRALSRAAAVPSRSR